ncbi:GNAT family N-acetyltransferase [Phytohabitans sp. ZYX-F-186]|uniref:GNAT family N-acetyltransferase n=1 Tax=Phytohabitans maris TaxID=3071409 RepID=A0ABU0Z948_9ACTN|nr:GNAT family N-acetyltransferase [Phytohabitans sp. ZYX-F-186]MDQ7902916.1 GNAT family N-acetyltransferase [Phytohabitans sp. ZYX-F-186]
MLIEARPVNDAELGMLITALQRELREAGGGLDVNFEEHAQHLVGVVDGRAVACGALQALDPQVGAIKRMYVRPAFRGRGIARQILAALEEMALDAGHVVLRLEAGVYLPAALALLRSAGYGRTPAHGFEKRILVAA